MEKARDGQSERASDSGSETKRRREEEYLVSLMNLTHGYLNVLQMQSVM